LIQNLLKATKKIGSEKCTNSSKDKSFTIFHIVELCKAGSLQQHIKQRLKSL